MFGFFEPDVPQISASEVHDLLDKKSDLLILDVRTNGEYAKGKIAGSINIPLDEVQSKITDFVKQKDKKVIVYCLSGSRSVHAVDSLIKLGFPNALNMTSGLLAWRNAGYSLIP